MGGQEALVEHGADRAASPVRIGFADFWPAFHPSRNFLHSLLRDHFSVELTDDPDYLIFSVFGRRHEDYRCCRILFTGENVRPWSLPCDYSIGFDLDESERHLRWPLYAYFRARRYLDLVRAPRDVDRIMAAKTRFCAMVVSNGKAPERLELFHRLNARRAVDSGGRVLNNVGGPVRDKFAFLSTRRFAIAYENSCHPGYTTEKVLDAFLCGCIPIHWGNPQIGLDFNARALISRHCFDSDEAMIEHVLEVDADPRLQRRYLAEPVFPGEEMPVWTDPRRVVEHFAAIFGLPAGREALPG